MLAREICMLSNSVFMLMHRGGCCRVIFWRVIGVEFRGGEVPFFSRAVSAE